MRDFEAGLASWAMLVVAALVVAPHPYLEAEAHVAQQPVPVIQTDQASLRKAMESRWGKRDDKEIPNAVYLAKKFDDLTPTTNIVLY